MGRETTHVLDKLLLSLSQDTTLFEILVDGWGAASNACPKAQPCRKLLSYIERLRCD